MLIKIPTGFFFFCKNWQVDKIYMEMLRIWNSQNNFEKKQIVELMTI